MIGNNKILDHVLVGHIGVFFIDYSILIVIVYHDDELTMILHAIIDSISLSLLTSDFFPGFFVEDDLVRGHSW